MSHITRFFVLLLAVLGAATIVDAQLNIQTHHSFPGEVVPLSALAATSESVSFRKPDGMILSEGNLYFTSHDAAGATVWRTAQTSSPGQETVLYWEAGATFGDIVFAKVDGNFFGYFFAFRRSNRSEITIKRVPLTGGTAIVLATLKDIDVENDHRNLLTDGVNLYWQDVSSVRKMPIRGGPVTVLDPCQDNTPTAGIALQNGNIIYASFADIRFVPPNGATSPPSSRTIVTAANRVTALHAVSNGVYWGDNDDAVKRKVGATTTTLQSSGGLATSISSSGTAAGGVEAWTDCAGTQCRLHLKFFLVNLTMPIGDDARGVSVTPARKVFWGDAAGVHRKAF